MKDITELSGNIKLRLPRSLHDVLIRQAEDEGVSLNQLCLMYLCAEVSKSNDNLGTEEFNRRLELIYLNSKSDEELFAGLDKLNDEVEVLIPRLLQDIKKAIDSKKRNMSDYIEVLRYIYPIFRGDIVGEKLPLLKIPSAKIVLCPKNNSHIDFKEIEKIVTEVCPEALVAYGDYDYFIPMERRLVNDARIMAISINVCCKYNDLRDKIMIIRKELINCKEINKMDLQIKPCYLYKQLRPMKISELYKIICPTEYDNVPIKLRKVRSEYDLSGSSIMSFCVLDDEEGNLFFKSTDKDTFIGKSEYIEIYDMNVDKAYELSRQNMQGYELVMDKLRIFCNEIVNPEYVFCAHMILHELGHYQQYVNCGKNVNKYINLDCVEKKRVLEKENQLYNKIQSRINQMIFPFEPNEEEKEELKQVVKEYRNLPIEIEADEFAYARMRQAVEKICEYIK